MLAISDGTEVSAPAVVLATGVTYRTLPLPQLAALAGAGVFYGASRWEAAALAGEDVYIVGGANSAGQAAMYFSRYARKVVMLVRGDSLTKGMSQYLIYQIGQTPTIEVRTNASVAAARGDEKLRELDVRDNLTGAVETVPASSLFILIGAQTRTT